MKMAIRRRGNAKLVKDRDAVLAMITAALDAPLPDVPASLSVLKEVEEAADALDLPLTGEEWGERLAIKKKGGGMHFDDGERLHWHLESGEEGAPCVVEFLY